MKPLPRSKRERALNSIDAKIAEVIKVSRPGSGKRLICATRRCMALQELKTKVAGLSSIPKDSVSCRIREATLLDDAMEVIEKASQKSATVAKDPGAATGSTVLTTGPRTTPPKPIKVIRAADLSPSIYLETEAEVEAYLARLKAELLDVIQSGKRARIS
jgi:hypothetical protein